MLIFQEEGKQPQSCHNDSSCYLKHQDLTDSDPRRDVSQLLQNVLVSFIVLKIKPEQELNLRPEYEAHTSRSCEPGC